MEKNDIWSYVDWRTCLKFVLNIREVKRWTGFDWIKIVIRYQFL
jgi:hypothetical protein